MDSVTWWALSKLLSWHPIIFVKSLQLIWELSTCSVDENYGYPFLKWFAATWLIGIVSV